MKSNQKIVNLILWSLIFILAGYILIKGTAILEEEGKIQWKTNIAAGANSIFSSLAVDKLAMETYMPGITYSVYEEESENENVIVKKIFESMPLYDYLKDSAVYETQIENDSTYEKILAAEGYDEDYHEVIEEDDVEEARAAEEETEGEENSDEETEEQEVEVLSKAVDISLEKLNDFDYLLRNFYIVDKMATVDSSILDANKFLSTDLSLEKNSSEPQILIYHSHSQEAFADSVEGDESTTIVGVGAYLTRLLEEKYGYSVIHHKGVYDLVGGVLDRNNAYTLAGEAASKILEENPSIEVVIDLHRDGIEGEKGVADINGKQAAQVMLLNGISRSAKNGELSYLPNPYIEENLSFSFQLKLKAEEYYPGYMKGIYVRALRYNLHLAPRTILVESGSQKNTVEEQMNAMEPLAELLNQVLAGE